MITIVTGLILLLFFLASAIRILRGTVGNLIYTAWVKNQKQKGSGYDICY
jgi:phosphomevalonate kinase